MKSKNISLGLLKTGDRTVQFYNEYIQSMFNESKILEDHTVLTTITSDFSTTNQYLPNQFEHLEPLLKKDIDLALKEKISTLIIPNITLHETLDRLVKKEYFPNIKIVHPLKTTVQALQIKNINKVVVIGSAYTSHCDWLNNYFLQHDIKTIAINNEHTQTIDKIRQRTYNGNETQEDKQHYNDLINHYQQQAPTVIACTELSILIGKKYGHNIYDMARIQMRAAMDIA